MIRVHRGRAEFVVATGIGKIFNEALGMLEVRVRYFDDHEIDMPAEMYESMVNTPPLDEVPWRDGAVDIANEDAASDQSKKGRILGFSRKRGGEAA